MKSAQDHEYLDSKIRLRRAHLREFENDSERKKTRTEQAQERNRRNEITAQ